MIRHLSLLYYFLFSVTTIAQPTEVRYLSGTDKDRTVDWEFHIDRGMNSGEWTTIPVPSNWELQGFGVYNYGRGNNEFSDETGTYRHSFEVPAAWEGRTVNIVFEGVMTDTRVTINGQSAGAVHQGGFYEFKYDISELLNYGSDNQLEVIVKNWSDNESVNSAERQADYWVFGGIYRPVYLEAKPRSHIDWTAVDARADGGFSLQVYLNNIERSGTVEGQIQTLNGQPVGDPFSAAIGPGSEHVELTTQIDEPRLWSPETPDLYQVQLELVHGASRHRPGPVRFGFRTVEVRAGDGIYVNGARVTFRGVNRHSFWPESGRCTSPELSVRDVQLMKDMNMNTVRMSHYPPDKHFLDACDSLGLFVFDELAGWQTSYDTEVGEKLVREMIIRDVNHPSIIVWDNGNEGGWNSELDDDFHLYDPQKRPLIHPWTKFRETDTQHYVSYNCCAGYGFNSDKIFFPTEVLHGLYDGGHGAGLEDYWNLMQQRPNNAGAFLWVFADEGVVRTDQNGRIDTWGSNAPDGIVGPYREKEGSYYTIKEIWSPVQVQPPANMDYFDGRLRVENNYMFTNLKDCAFTWQLIDFPAPAEPAGGIKVRDEGQSAGPDLPPGESGQLTLDMPGNWKAYDALRLRIEDPKNREVFTYVFPILRPADKMRELVPTGEAPVQAREDEEFFYLANGPTEVTIDRRTGMLRSVKHLGETVSFGGGPSIDAHLGAYQLREIEVEKNGRINALKAGFEGLNQGDRRSIDWSARYEMLGGGWLRIDYEYLPPQGEYDYLGVNFSYPEEKVKSVRWLGRGPYRLWKNRMKGPQLGVWEKEYNNTVTGESGWEYPEFKGYHADLYWARLETEEAPILIATETPGLFLRLFTPEPPEGAYNDNTDGVFPAGDISILHGISPIGTKFKDASELGPMSQPHQLYYNRSMQPYKGTIYLKFGE